MKELKANDPANPCGMYGQNECEGFTKRELMAMELMKSFLVPLKAETLWSKIKGLFGLGRKVRNFFPDNAAEKAIIATNDLIAQLNKEQVIKTFSERVGFEIPLPPKKEGYIARNAGIPVTPKQEGAINFLIHEESGKGNLDTSLISDGYHTFGELYDFRKVYNAALFNQWAKSSLYEVHKSYKHFDGELCFGGGWFIVVAVLPSGQISNHYKNEDWDLFRFQEVEKALYEFDGHTPADVLERLKGI